MSRRFIRRLDIVMIVAAAALSAAGWLAYRGYAAGKPARAEIYAGGRLARVLDLTDEGALEFALPGAPSVVIRKEGHGVWFESSDCPDQVCVRTGVISLPGSFAACLPNGVMIRVAEESGGGIDSIAR